MKFEIDLENSSLSEYFTEEEDGITFTEVFKEEVVREFLHKMSWNSDFRDFVRSEIRNGLHPKIVEWKQDAAIKAVVEDTVKEELKPMRSGNYFYAEEYKTKVQAAVKKVMIEYVVEINALIEKTVRNEVKNILDDIYKDNPMRDFIDMPKVTNYVMNLLKKDGKLNENN